MALAIKYSYSFYIANSHLLASLNSNVFLKFLCSPTMSCVACFLFWGSAMWFFHHSPSDLGGLSRYLKFLMISLPYYGGGGGLVAIFLSASSFDAYPLQVDFAAGTSASNSSSMFGFSMSGSLTSPLTSNSSTSDLVDISIFTAGGSSILPLGQFSKCILSSKNTTSKLLMIFFVSK